MSVRRRRRSATQVLELLKDPAFCTDARHLLEMAQRLRESGRSFPEWERQMSILLQPFLARWGVVPPTTGELLDADPRRRLVDAIASGSWGTICVFPWTTDKEVGALTRRIRHAIPTRHRDALSLHNPQAARWLEACRFTRPQIARAVLNRKTGLRRPTKDEVSRRNERRQSQLFEEYGHLKLKWGQIEQRVYKRLRGSEARASATIRMLQRRYERAIEQLNRALERPIKTEPVSYALTMLFRLLPDGDAATIRQHVVECERACSRASRVSVGSRTTHRTARSGETAGAIATGRWGIVPVYPWTTAAEVRESIKRIRAVIRRRQDSDTSAHASQDRAFHDPFSFALAKLFGGIGTDGIALRRSAIAARNVFMEAFPS
jgi:hypothetical protein